MALCSALLLAAPLSATPPSPAARRAEIDVEYLGPISASRQIDTVSLHAIVGRDIGYAAWLALRGGLTLSYATGYILQWDEQFRDVRSANTALGGGPVGVVRLRTPPLAGLRLEFEGSGGLLLYSRDFPAGGDVYNFMWRAGPSLGYVLGPALALSAGYRVMHVSNGQGLGPHNPSYAAEGVVLAFDAAW